MEEVLRQWRASLAGLLGTYDARRGRIGPFVTRLFLFFVLLNAGCYWLGILVAYPGKLAGPDWLHYVWLQVPVGVLGALFDTASFFVTVFVVRRALQTRNAVEYVLHLSIDLAIAVIATFWVLFVFTASGWILSYIEAQPELLAERTAKYEGRLADAIRSPGRNWRNVYFGIVMGISASLPTLVHLGMFVRALFVRRPRDGELGTGAAP